MKINLFNIEEFAVAAVGILAGLFEPLVLVGAVVDHEVHDDADAALFALGDQAVHVLHRAEAWVDRVVVRDVIALVRERGDVDRREPEEVDAELLQGVQPGNDARKVADAVAVGVAEAFRINLVGDFVMPPYFFHIILPFLTNTGIP